jgi:hypothetical protein
MLVRFMILSKWVKIEVNPEDTITEVLEKVKNYEEPFLRDFVKDKKSLGISWKNTRWDPEQTLAELGVKNMSSINLTWDKDEEGNPI